MISLRLSIFTSLTIATTLFSGVMNIPSAYTCSCIGYPNAEEGFEEHFQRASLVVLGTPMKLLESGEWNNVYLVSVEKVWKGQTDTYVEITTAKDSAMCGVHLSMEERTVIFAYEQDGGLWTNICSGTQSVEDDSDLVSWLNTQEGSSQSTPSCDPYVCSNGESHPSCTEDGHVIHYLVHPCEFSDVPTKEESPFLDVASTHPYFEAIVSVQEQGIVQGYNDGTYRPDAQINRAEFTKIMIGAAFASKNIQSCNTEELFSDVPATSWFSPYVCVAKKEHIVSGYADGTFAPEQYINNAEAAKILVETFNIPTDPNESSSIWWKKYIFALSHINALPSSITDPNQLLSRGEMAEIVYRVLGAYK